MSRKRRSTRPRTPDTAIEAKVYKALKTFNVDISREATVGRYTVDFLVDGKYIIECHGDYWHCHPEKYSPTYYNRGKKKFAAEIWKRDEARIRELAQAGYPTLVLWESDIRNDHAKVLRLIKRHVRRS